MEDANRILRAYLHVSRLLSERLRGRINMRSLTFPQTMVLALLHEEGPMTISGLANATGSAASTTSGIVNRLEQMGLTRRVRSEQDHRVVYVAVTEHFEQVYEERTSDALGQFSGLINRLTPEQREQVENGLALLEDVLTQEEEA